MIAQLLPNQKYCPSCGALIDSPKIVVSRGNPYSKLMLLGEAPGEKEECIGKPFVGRSGQLLDSLLEIASIDPCTDIYISNVVKSRPPKNRRPLKKEISDHMPWLLQQIKLIDPHVIILAGSTALVSLLGTKSKITQLRGTWQNWNGIPVMPIFHPSYLLRNPSKAKGGATDLTRLDLIKVRKKLDTAKICSDVSSSGIQRSNSL